MPFVKGTVIILIEWPVIGTTIKTASCAEIPQIKITVIILFEFLLTGHGYRPEVFRMGFGVTFGA
jgi:hypothetical protein